MILIKKIVVFVTICLIGLIGFGYLPRKIANRITRALVAVFVLGFLIRVGAYLLQ